MVEECHRKDSERSEEDVAVFNTMLIPLHRRDVLFTLSNIEVHTSISRMRRDIRRKGWSLCHRKDSERSEEDVAVSNSVLIPVHRRDVLRLSLCQAGRGGLIVTARTQSEAMRTWQSRTPC